MSDFRSDALAGIGRLTIVLSHSPAVLGAGWQKLHGTLPLFTLGSHPCPAQFRHMSVLGAGSTWGGVAANSARAS